MTAHTATMFRARARLVRTHPRMRSCRLAFVIACAPINARRNRDLVMVAIAGTSLDELRDSASCTAVHERYRAVRRTSETLCQPLAADDYGLQAMPDVSPPKWHLAH